MKTYRATEKDLNYQTFLVDADGQILGRLATKIASILMGKGKAVYARDQFCGDGVVVINAEKIKITGNSKPKQKVYTHYTGYNSGLKSITFEKLLEKKPEEIILQAVRRMLPKNKLGREMMRRLRVYAGAEHKQQAQKPVEVANG